MSDFHAVGLDVKPADPSQAFNSINSILGIQSKRQDLLIQAQQLQQEQLKTQQAQGLQDFYKNFDPTKHIGSDGTTDVNSVHNSATYQNAGNAKPLIDKALGDIKQQQLGAKQSLQTLDDDTLTQLSRVAGSLANDEDVKDDNEAGRQKVEDAYRSFASLGPQAARISGTFGQVTKHAQQGHLADALYAQQLMGADVLGQRGQQNPQAGTNAAGQATVADVRTGARRLAPVGGGTQEQVNPAAPDVAGRTARVTAVAGSDTERANQISATIQPSQAAIGTTQRIDDLAEQISSGHFAKWVMDKAAAVGVSDPAVVARQLLEKDLGQVKNLAGSSAATDEKMRTVLSGYPEATSAPQTIHTAMDYIRGSFRQNVARGDLLNSYREKNPNLNGLQHADDVLTGKTDPWMHEFKSLKSAQERIDFYKRNFPTSDKAKDFKHRVSAMEHLNVLGQ
jgi:hypothetical protein